MSHMSETTSRSKSSPPSTFAVAVMIGALGLSVTDTLPGGWSGGGGFLAGLVVALVVFSTLNLLFGRQEQKASR